MTKFLIRLFIQGRRGLDANQVDNPRVRTAYGLMAGIVGIVCNLLLVFGKLVAGWLSGSISILADAVNNISDASSSVITLVGFRLSAKPADKEHPFGHGRFEYIATLFVSLVILLIGVEIAKSSFAKIFDPVPTEHSLVSYGVLIASILIKIWMAFFNRDIGRRIDSSTLKAAFADSRNDVIATGVVLAGAFLSQATGWNLDGFLGLGVAVFILVSGIKLVKETLDPLLGPAPDKELVDYIDKKISRYPGILGTHDLLVHDYGPGRQFASAHVEISSADDVVKSHAIIDQIERDFLEQDNIHLIIHYDPVVTDKSGPRAVVARQLATIDKRITLHDFRQEETPDKIVYCFDVVVPSDLALSEQALQERIQKVVQQEGKPIQTQVTIDTSYASIPK